MSSHNPSKTDQMVVLLRRSFPARRPINLRLYDGNPEDPDYQRLDRDFGGKSWYDISDEVVQFHYMNLPLFSLEALVFYLPAFMSYSIRCPSLDELEWLLMTLVPDPKLNKMHEAVDLMARTQRQAIGAFLLHALMRFASEEDEEKNTRIRDAIKFYESA